MSPSPSTATTATLADIARAAGFAKFASDPTRVSIVLTLGDGEHSGEDLVEATGSKPATLASHLAMLRVGGMIESERGPRESRHRLTERGRKLLGMIESLSSVD
jgi:DNA-binding transcriptional ArsR family regulator